jgi:hypothetical protein
MARLGHDEVQVRVRGRKNIGARGEAASNRLPGGCAGAEVVSCVGVRAGLFAMTRGADGVPRVGRINRSFWGGGRMTGSLSGSSEENAVQNQKEKGPRSSLLAWRLTMR